MKIGLTYDLRDDYLAQGYTHDETAEFDKVETIDALVAELQSLEHACERIGNVTALAQRLNDGARWDLVFNIAEGLHGFGREAQVPALLDAYQIPYTFSDPLILALTMHKGFTKRVVRDWGIATADFVVVESLSDIGNIVLPFPLFAKPVAEGSSKGISAGSLVRTCDQLFEQCSSLLLRYRQPVLVETFLPGRELTVGIVGTGDDTRVLGVMEVLLEHDSDRDAYSYANKVDYESRVKYRLVNGDLGAEASRVALEVWRRLGCRDAGRVDLRCDAAGLLNFLEVNPLAGLNPQHSDLPILCSLAGISYRELIAMILDSACRRLNTRRSEHAVRSSGISQ